jgi:hypothetical protein
LITRFFGGNVRSQIEGCIAASHKLIALYLLEKYRAVFAEERAVALAVAVSNELFGRPPGNEAGQSFLTANRSLVEEHLARLKNEPELRQIMSTVVGLKLSIARNSGRLTPEMQNWAMKLSELGILFPTSEMTLPDSLEGLQQQVRAFEIKVLGLGQ